jgi:hypothetical protein
MNTARRAMLTVGGLSNLAIAALQVTLAFLGPTAIRYFGAPPWAQEVVSRGGALFLLTAIAAALVSVAVGLYGLSLAGFGPRLPWVRAVVLVVGGGYTLWGMRVLPLVLQTMQQPGTVAPRFFLIRGIPLALGLLYLVGAWRIPAVQRRGEPAHNSLTR